MPKLWDQLNCFLARLRSQKTISEGQEQILSDMMRVTTEKHLEEEDRQFAIDCDYLAGNSTWEENTEGKREIGCLEYEMNPGGSRQELDALIDEEIVSEGKDGVALAEPPELIPYRAIGMTSSKLLTPQGIQESRGLSYKFGKLLPKLVTELPSRKSVVNALSDIVPNEEAIIMSGTPSIFNPYEFKEAFKNHTRVFCLSLGQLTKPVHYVWNENLVNEQIRQHIQAFQGPITALQEEYYDHLTKFHTSHLLRLHIGANGHYTDRHLSVCYLSKDRVMVGRRKGSKIVSGKLIHRSRLHEWVGKVPFLKSFQLPIEIATSFPELADFDSLWEELLRGEKYRSLVDNHPLYVVKFIEEQFERALSGQP